MHARMRIMTLRNKWLKRVKGSVSGVTRRILRDNFLGGKSIANAGVNLPLIGVPVKIKFEGTLADEEALNAIFFTKGAAGIVPCLGCNVVNKQKGSDRDRDIAELTEIDPELVDISCPDINRIGLRCDDDVWQICDALEEAAGRQRNKRKVAEIEDGTGIKFDEHSLLFDRELRPHVSPTGAVIPDPMHILLSSGIVGKEVILFVHQVKKDHDFNVFEGLRAMGEHWQPKVLIFSEKREKSSKETLKAGASEILSGYALLRRFIHDNYGASAQEPHVRSILLLFQICDDFLLLNKHLPDPEKEVIRTHLRSLVREYMVAFKEAHGKEKMLFKHHQLLHWVEQHPQLSCFCLERKHITAKKCIQNTTKLQHVAKGSLFRMLNQQVRMLENPGWGSALGHNANDFPEMARSLGARKVLIAAHLNYKGITMKHGQLVFMDPAKTDLIYIAACLSIDDEFGLVMRRCQPVSRTQFDSVWQMPTEVQIMHLNSGINVFPVAFFKFLPRDRVEVLH